MKKKIERIKELFSKLPNWAHVIVGLILVVTVIILWTIIWDFISPFTIKWILNPLGYIIIIIINAGIGLFSGYWLVKVTIGVLLGLSKNFGEIKLPQQSTLTVLVRNLFFFRNPRVLLFSFVPCTIFVCLHTFVLICWLFSFVFILFIMFFV